MSASTIAGAGKVVAAILRTPAASTAQVRRRQGVPVVAADGSAATPWSDVTGEGARKLLLEPISVAAAQRLWGNESEARFKGYAEDGADVQELDGLRITAGPYTGSRFKVVEAAPWPIAGLLVVGLSAAREDFV